MYPLSLAVTQWRLTWRTYVGGKGEGPTGNGKISKIVCTFVSKSLNNNFGQIFLLIGFLTSALPGACLTNVPTYLILGDIVLCFIVKYSVAGAIFFPFAFSLGYLKNNKKFNLGCSPG